ncbi:Flp pilus assembly complex ATPase component TadA [Methanobacterium alkalithermotolerans]|uniref:Flp pilus assembly complex ATPase component TadA n=1 Tax=Methanobacterium alkalithermotolerans TaxID=2731220 RepID=A0A8T8K592_9EURY|nr:PINc/VapC family ATPase [Methanobacterium alkalithermotolerans]QUH22283.1 Flp pilus assembly complex ATPase component TadA [Methanobacterium alkalithermotolerans]
MKIVPDTSVIVDGRITSIVQEEEFRGSEVIVPEAVVSELEYQANRGRETGFNGLSELKNLQKLHKDHIITISFVGRRPTLEEISLSRGGEIDAMIRSTARDIDAVLVTSDRVQSEVGKAQGLDVVYIRPEVMEYEELEITKYFDPETMSVHLKENVVPMAKKGTPGNIQLLEIGSRPLKHSHIHAMAREIVERAKSDFKSFIEIEMEGATVVQFREYRISIARPPFSEAFEITVVRPITRVSLDDYRLPEKLVERLRDTAKGILISGSPGAGKSTFAQAVADFFSKDLKTVVKTMESPRDLQVGDEITQYAPLEKDMQKTADILLLVRPDYTIYDELRKSRDFKIFADMRLAGVGMIGVVHATRPIDAIQRIIGRVELGVIPSVVDTTIFIDEGKVKAIYDVKLTVKVPSGMQEADLSRPVIEIRNFENGELAHEIYTYGEQTIVMDVGATGAGSLPQKTPVQKIAEREIEREIKKKIRGGPVKVVVKSDKRAQVWIEEKNIPQIIGKKGKNIEELEKKIGISIGIEPLESRKREDIFEIPVEITGNYMVLNFGKDAIGVAFDIIVEKEYLFTATVGKKGTIKIKKDMELADIIKHALDKNKAVLARVRPE